MSAPVKILFVCSRNNRRSPTAERIFQEDRRVEVRSAGLHDVCKRKVTVEDLAWADLVLVMERKYIARIKNTFRQLEALPPIESMNISDEYIFMQAELIELLQEGLDAILEEWHDGGFGETALP